MKPMRCCSALSSGAVQAGDILAVEDDAAFGRALQAVDAAQQGRLAGAGAADHGDDLAGADFEVDRLEGFVAVWIDES